MVVLTLCQGALYNADCCSLVTGRGQHCRTAGAKYELRTLLVQPTQCEHVGAGGAIGHLLTCAGYGSSSEGFAGPVPRRACSGGEFNWCECLRLFSNVGAAAHVGAL
eukprot:12835034-Alexandrium_andersonii.AAC.1